jgi:ribosomal protein S18 acetylase RimI-like enzyme
MPIHEVRAAGLEALTLATTLLQRARLADPHAGVWEAADVQWWWRMPRRSDNVEQRFWVDDEGPVAAVLLTDWHDAWACDPVIVPGVPGVDLPTVWAHALEALDELELEAVEVLARDDDRDLLALLAEAGFTAGDEWSGGSWMDADDRPDVPVPKGFVIVDRVGATTPHPMRARNGDAVEERLRECSLYDPALDLSVETMDGAVAGYSLFWFDPVTEVGLVEPMRVEDAFQRRGLARALIGEGLERLASRGARRLKVGFATEAARALYVGAGFRVTETSRSFRGPLEA